MMCNALGHFAQLSGGRVKQIAKIAELFRPGSRARWVYGVKFNLSFGYFENVIALDPKDWLLCLDFVVECERDINLLGRRPNVGEFVWMYEKHILGKKLISYGETLPPIEKIAPDSHQKPAERFTWANIRYVVQSLLEAKNGVKRILFGHQEKPKVREFMDALDTIDRLAPEMMREVGIIEDVEVKTS